MEETVKVEKQEQELVQEVKNDENDVLNSVSDEYLAKRKRKKIITFSLISGFTLLISLVIIILACIKIDTKPKFIENNPLTYDIYLETGEPSLNLEQTDPEYEEFNNRVNSIFKTQLLTAMFTGRLKGYDINETTSSFYSSTSAKTGQSSELKNRLNTSYIRIKYDHDIKLLNKDGSEYKSVWSPSYTLTFNEMYFNIYDTNQEHEVTLLLATDGYLTGRITEVKVKVNTYSLYQYVAEFSK